MFTIIGQIGNPGVMKVTKSCPICTHFELAIVRHLCNNRAMNKKESLLKGELMFSYKIYFTDGVIWHLDTDKDPLEVCELGGMLHEVVSVETVGEYVEV